MLNQIKWFFTNLFRSLFNDNNGFSMRKCIAIIIVKISLILQIEFVSSENLESIMIIDFSFASLLLGIVTIQNLIELKNGKPN